jgi:phytoene dehydrogenase-like protein
VALAREGRSVTVYEAEAEVGGGCRSAELTLPGYLHDVCSAIHPLAAGSPFFREVNLAIDWIQPALALAHPLDDGTAVALHASVDETAAGLGVDGAAYRRLIGPLAEGWDALLDDVMLPIAHLPRHPIGLARFGLLALLPARVFARAFFREVRARALFGGLAAHSFLPLDAPLTTSFALMIGVSAHTVGWPLPRGGSRRIPEALADVLRAHGGEIVTGRRVRSVRELPSARAVLFDLTPRQVERIAGDRLPDGYRRALRRYRYGPGVFKLDYALSAPIPWTAQECRMAGTVHLGGTFEEVAASEAAVASGVHADRPFVLVAQQSLFDPSRAPQGHHTAWVYCHVPRGSTVDMTERVEAQLERFAPGFRDIVLARSAMNTADLERHNENFVGGDISAGSHAGLQLFARPALRLTPYATPAKDLYICSAATPPGGGVHGMCGHNAAQAALRRSFA